MVFSRSVPLSQRTANDSSSLKCAAIFFFTCQYVNGYHGQLRKIQLQQQEHFFRLFFGKFNASASRIAEKRPKRAQKITHELKLKRKHLPNTHPDTPTLVMYVKKK